MTQTDRTPLQIEILGLCSRHGAYTCGCEDCDRRGRRAVAELDPDFLPWYRLVGPHRPLAEPHHLGGPR